MALNQRPVNTEAVNSGTSAILAYGIGSLFSIEQTVGKSGSGQLFEIEQDVELRLSTTTPSSFILIEQTERVLVSSSALFTIEARVVAP